MGGGTYGTELFADWRVIPKWRLLSSYSYLQMDIRKDLNSLDPTPDNPGLVSPRHQFYVRSSSIFLNILNTILIVRYIDRLPGVNIPSYYSVDTHFGWRPRRGPELSVGSQNLLNRQHLEFLPDFINTSPTEVKRTFYGSITWRFE